MIKNINDCNCITEKYNNCDKINSCWLIDYYNWYFREELYQEFLIDNYFEETFDYDNIGENNG